MTGRKASTRRPRAIDAAAPAIADALRGIPGGDMIVDAVAGALDPDAALKAAIRHYESRGNDNAANPRRGQTASGRYGFTRGTWLLMHPRAYPGRMTDAQRWAQRGDGNVQERVMDASLAQYRLVLGTARIEASPANLYLSHFLSPENAVLVVRAPGARLDATLANRRARGRRLYSPAQIDEVFRANGLRRDWTNGQVIAEMRRRTARVRGPRSEAGPPGVAPTGAGEEAAVELAGIEAPIPDAALADPDPAVLIGETDASGRAIAGQAFVHIAETLAEHRRTLPGRLRAPAAMEEIGKAAFGEKTESLSAAELAGSWSRAAERLRQRANAAGANIARVENWGLPRAHDGRRVAEAGFEAWRAAEAPRMDPGRMTDPQTGQPLTAAGFERLMRAEYEAIAGDGAGAGAPGPAPGGVLHYRDFASWQASREEFGRGNVFDAMAGHIHDLSRSVAAMEMLGPDPDEGARWLRDAIAGDGAEARGLAVERLWDDYAGASRQPPGKAMALGFGTYRAAAAAAAAAETAAADDPGFNMAARRFGGLPQAGLLADHLKLFDPADAAHRALASRLGFAADSWIALHAAQGRGLAEEMNGEIASRLAGGALGASGRNAFAEAGRGANGLVWLTQVTNERGTAWDALEPAFRAALRHRRIGAGIWDAIRATPLEEDGGAAWIKPRNIADRAIADRLFRLAYDEEDFAVPAAGSEPAYSESPWRDSAFLSALTRAAPDMLRTFTLPLMIRHGGRMLGEGGFGGQSGDAGFDGALGFALSMAIPATLIGALSLQLKAVAAGRDPHPTADPAFWGQAMAKGGGLDIAAGLLGLTGEAKPGDELWYDRLAFDRLLADRIQSLTDPKYPESWQRMEQRAREQGQGTWWQPDEEDGPAGGADPAGSGAA